MGSRLLDDLLDWLRIPSISTGGGDPKELERAAEWVCARIERGGGSASLVPTTGSPLVVGHLPSAQPGAPSVLLYGHYDVQGIGDPDSWTSAPFEPEVRDGRVYGRGAADDKGNFLPLLHAACELCAAGRLPIDVRVVVEGEEEVDSAGVIDWLTADADHADAAIVFDAAAVDERTAAITVAMRGLLTADVRVRTARRDLHSGLYGGAARNAANVLARMLAAVVADDEGRLAPDLCVGTRAPSDRELAAWALLPAGADALAAAGAEPSDADAASQFHLRTWAAPSLDVNQVGGGEPRTMIPAEAHARLSMRLAPGQDGAVVAAALERLLRKAAGPGSEPEIVLDVSDPILLDAEEPAIAIACEAFERALGRAPLLVRSGGSIPVVAALVQRGITPIVSGFSLPADAIHGPDESFRLSALETGERAARDLLLDLGRLPPGR